MLPLRNTSTREQSHKFFDFTGQVNHRFALRSKLPQLPVQLGLRTNVNAARRVVQN
jgi:hypothetical protein